MQEWNIKYESRVASGHEFEMPGIWDLGVPAKSIRAKPRPVNSTTSRVRGSFPVRPSRASWIFVCGCADVSLVMCPRHIATFLETT